MKVERLVILGETYAQYFYHNGTLYLKIIIQDKRLNEDYIITWYARLISERTHIKPNGITQYKNGTIKEITPRIGEAKK